MTLGDQPSLPGRTHVLILVVASLVLAFAGLVPLTWSQFVHEQYAFLGVDRMDWVAFRAFDQEFAPVARWTDVGGGTNVDPWFNARPHLRGYGRSRVAIHDATANAVGWFIIGDGRLDEDLLGVGADIIPTLTKIVEVTTDADGAAWLFLPLDLGFEETAYFQYWTHDAIGWVASNGLEMHTSLPLAEKRSTWHSEGLSPGTQSGP